MTKNCQCFDKLLLPGLQNDLQQPIHIYCHILYKKPRIKCSDSQQLWIYSESDKYWITVTIRANKTANFTVNFRCQNEKWTLENKKLTRYVLNSIWLFSNTEMRSFSSYFWCSLIQTEESSDNKIHVLYLLLHPSSFFIANLNLNYTWILLSCRYSTGSQ